MNKFFLFIIAFLGVSNFSFSQTNISGQDTKNANPITTAVPFLTIVPESRGGAMGDVGVATSPDVSSIRYNIAKYPFIKNDYGVSISYTPWLRNLVSDINLLDISGYIKTDEKQAIAASLTYFSLGNIQFLDEAGSFIRDYTPNEFALKAGYSRLLTKDFSLGISLAYIYSNLTGGYSNSSTEATSGNSFAADIGLFYNKDITIDSKDANFALGFSINNIGNKMSYSEGIEKDFIPTTLLLGGALTFDLDEYNSIMGSLQFSKLLVPTPPIYYNTGEINDEGDTVRTSRKYIKSGIDPNVSVVTGMIQSFYDAPGGSGEEMSELMWALGMEYWYAKQFALRAGYFHESMYKGNRKFFSLGIGLKYNVFGLDFAYLVPINGNQSPLANTLRFSISFDFAALNEKK